jgi:hypothetical protein
MIYALGARCGLHKLHGLHGMGGAWALQVYVRLHWVFLG